MRLEMNAEVCVCQMSYACNLKYFNHKVMKASVANGDSGHLGSGYRDSHCTALFWVFEMVPEWKSKWWFKMIEKALI